LETRKYIVNNHQRIDNFLAQMLNQTRTQVANFIKNGFVSVDGKKSLKPGLKLKPQQTVFVSIPQAQKTTPLEVNFDVEIIYEDEHLLVINKPSGVIVHPAPSVKEATLVDWLKKRGISLSTISGEERHGIVHRLDKGTSGVMVVAKTNQAHTKLSAQLEDKSMGRYYLAVITPPFKEITTVEKPIARNPKNRLKMGIVSGGKEAKTAFLPLVLSKDEKTQLIACKLFTGRTHQIRVHLESLSRHIIGDEVYGAKISKISSEQILLHAYIIYFVHPVTKEKMSFKVKYDEVFEKYISKKFDMEIVDEKISPDYISSSFGSFI